MESGIRIGIVLSDVTSCSQSITLNGHRRYRDMVIICDSMYANLISGLAESACLIRPHENPALHVDELVN